MSLASGAELGPYRILSLIGKGGMGEVYLAEDSRLSRNIAIKVSAAQFSERFDREAQAAAQLNHPNVCTLHDVGPNYLVMEYVDGETLADRIKQGPIPLDEALRLAHQIIDGMEAAHEKGITHRDLKPANIKIKPDGSIKILDFGLAKTASTPASSGAPSENSPTLTMGMTEAGMILGTAAYMAPEQAKGKVVDKRTDIWAFGVVLHEMLTAERLFEGEDVGETLAAVIKERPDFSRAPQRVQRLLGRCLEKDPRRRLRDIGDARMLLEETPLVTPEAAIVEQLRPRVEKAMWALAGLLALAGLAGWGLWWRATRPGDHPLIRLSADLGPDAATGSNLTAAISRDGARIAFPIRGPGGKQMLATRLLDQSTPTVLSGTENAAGPFFSPDGKWIGFQADGKLKKISVLGGAALTLCDMQVDRGASWGEDGNIVFTTANAAGLWRVPDTGGTPQVLTKPPDKGEATHRWPQVLPDGKAVLFTGKAPEGGPGGVLGPGYDDANIEALSLKTGQIKILVRGGFYGRYVPDGGSTGHLVYVHQGVMFGAPFDPGKLEVHGAPVPFLEDVASSVTAGGGQYDLSATGTLVYLSGKADAQSGWPVMWMDSSGKTEPLLAMPGIYNTPRFSPDGNLLAISMVANSRGQDLYVYDWHHDTMPRLTFNGQANRDPVWAPDGKHIAFDASDGLYWVRADGAGEPERLLESKVVIASSFSPDGKRLAYTVGANGVPEVWTLPLDLADPEHPKPGKPELYLRTNVAFGMFSPDGRWVAYQSNESGQLELYVRPFPGPGGKWQISTGGGRYSVWSRNGRELFFDNPAGDRIMVTEYTAKADSFSYSKPRVWSDKQLRYTGGREYFDLAPDGKRFAVFPRGGTADEKQGSVHVIFLLNFFDDIRRRIPTN